jgi:serine/threonine protein phosphatase 1
MGHLFAISDIHGCYNPFYELVVNVLRLQKSDHLMLLGDYIDRGTQSREVIDFIIDLQQKGFNVTALAGNHELMLINSYSFPEVLPLWLMNNGGTTMESFGIDNIEDIDRKYLDFFNSLEYYRIIGNVIFVHAGFDDLATDPFSDLHSLVWESRTSYQNPLLSDKIIIHGHRPKTISYIQKQIRERSHVIPIDSGCVYSNENGYGSLSALDVLNMNLYSVPNF